jgi:hypothetical protein
MAQPIPMPISGDRHAPTFDPVQPRTLSRYFDNLDELLARAQIVTDADRKKYAIRYVTIDVADQWEELDTYTGGSYLQWKAEVFALYPGADSTVRYTRQGLLEYVNHWKSRGFRTIGDWAEFYRNYSTQSKWLINKTIISSIDQKRWCEDAIGAQMSNIATRLQVKLPDVHPGDGYPLNELDSAMRFLLHGTSTALSAPVAAPTPTPIVMPIVPPPATTSSPPAIKTEDIGRLLEYFQRLLPVASQQTSASTSQAAPPRVSASSEKCHYCGREGERLANCTTAEEDIRKGLIKRNAEGRIVLPSGSFVPRHITGTWMRDRIQEWHRQNPNQTAAGSIAYGAVWPETSSSMMLEVQNGATYDGRAASYTYHRDDQERIRALEQEIYALRKERFDGVYMPPPPRARRPRSPTPGPAARVPVPENTSTTPEPTPAPVASSAPAPVTSSPASTTAIPVTAATPPASSITSSPPAAPEHPLASARDATYLLPTQRNVAAPLKPKENTRDPAFRTAAPIEDPKIVEQVLDRLLKEKNIAMTTEELFAISPDIRNRVRTLVTPKRTTAALNEIANFHHDGTEVILPSVDSLLERDQLPRGVIRIKDPYETYLRALSPGEPPRPLRVAPESNALRTVRALVAEKDEVDCILDPGCQIVACSEAVCHELGFSYDPSVVLHMQSANGEVDRSLGLARNVPFTVGDMTFYLQVHVIRQAAYDILLGRPFDVVASSVVRNFENEDQTITLHCPNTGRSITVPTLPRGRPRFRMPPPQDF